MTADHPRPVYLDGEGRPTLARALLLAILAGLIEREPRP